MWITGCAALDEPEPLAAAAAVEEVPPDEVGGTKT